MVAATATSTTEKRSTRLRGAGFVAVWLRVVGTATVITPLAAGAAIGRTACAPRASFHPDCTVGPGVGLHLHRVMRRRTLAGFTADRGFTPLPRRPTTTIAAAGKGRSRDRACGRLSQPVAQPSEIAIADRYDAQVGHLLFDPREGRGLLERYPIEESAGRQDILVRGDVILRQAVGHDDVRPVELLHPADSKS